MHEIMAQQLINGKQQFIDGNGNPLAGGSVAFYQPGTLTPVNTYQDPGLTTPNTNPVVLDANGMAAIWGALGTQYRQVVTNALGAQLWDQVVGTTGVSTAQSVQAGAYNSAHDTGVINAYAMTLSPPPAALTPGMTVTLQNIGATNTGAATLNVNGLGILPINTPDKLPIAAGVLNAGADAILMLNAAGIAWTLVAGAPIVESGVNANGRWTKFSDGTMLCASAQAINVAAGGTSQGAYDFLFPATFVNIPQCSITMRSSPGVFSTFTPVTPYVNKVSAYVVAITGTLSAASPICDVIAIGSWK